MHPRILGNASGSTSKRSLPPGAPPRPNALLRLPTSLPSGFATLANRQTASSLAILEGVDRLASLSLDQPRHSLAEQPSLIRGFKATIPSSEMAKQRRRLIRGGMAEEELGGKMGLKRLGDRARGLLTEGNGEEGEGSESSHDGTRRSRRKAREKRRAGEAKSKNYHLEDLVKQADEIAQDKDNLQTRSVSPAAFWLHGYS